MAAQLLLERRDGTRAFEPTGLESGAPFYLRHFWLFYLLLRAAAGPVPTAWCLKAPRRLPCFSRTKSALQITPRLLNRCFTHSLLLLISPPPRYTSWLPLRATCVGCVFPITIMKYLILLCVLSSSSFTLLHAS